MIDNSILYVYDENGYHNGRQYIKSEDELVEKLTSNDMLLAHYIVTDSFDELIMEVENGESVGFGYGASEEDIKSLIEKMTAKLKEKVNNQPRSKFDQLKDIMESEDRSENSVFNDLSTEY